MKDTICEAADADTSSTAPPVAATAATAVTAGALYAFDLAGVGPAAHIYFECHVSDINAHLYKWAFIGKKTQCIGTTPFSATRRWYPATRPYSSY